jgi:DNA-directed RNA polymerase subunit RPC12/RpoP
MSIVVTDPIPQTTPSADQRGLVCRHCGCKHFYVVYTRPAGGGKLVRRRECRHCGRRVTTWEKMIGW